MGDAIVILHGFPGNAQDWLPLARRLAGQYRVIVPDLRGFGRSDYPDSFDELSVQAQAQAILSALDRAGTDRFALVGHDFGMAIAVKLAVLAGGRVRGVVLSAGNVFRDPPLQPPMRLLPLPVVGSIAEAALFSGPAIRWMGTNGVKLNGNTPTINSPKEVRSIRTIFATALRELDVSFGPVEDALPRLQAPVLVIWGERDPFFNVDHARRVVDALPEAKLIVYDGVGHFPHLEAPDRLLADITAFQRQVTENSLSN